MPRLPDVNSLGGVPNLQSGRPIATFDTTSIGQGIASIGKGIGDVGNSIERVATANDELGYMRARASFYPKNIELQNSFVEDNDYNTFETRYSEGAIKARDEAASLIANPRLKQRFITETADDLARGQVAIQGLARKREGDVGLADTYRQLDTLKETIFKAPTEEDKVRLIDSASGIIDAARAKQWVSEVGAFDLKKKWTENYAQEWLASLPPAQRIEALRGGFRDSLKARESSGMADRVNPFGYAGFYQFGAPRLADIGVYTPGENENLKTWSKTGTAAAGKWSGSFNVPGFPEVKTLQDFLSNPQAQEAVYDLHQKKMDKEISDNGLDKFEGKVVGGVPITRDGLYGMIHLGGVAGAKKTLESGGAVVASDANGTSVLDYAKMGSTPGAGRIAGFLPEAQRIKLQNATEIELRQDTERRNKEVDRRMKEVGESFLKEGYKRAEDGNLSTEYVESIRPFISPAEYKGLLATFRAEAQSNDPEAMIDLTKRIDTTNPDEFQTVAADYLRRGKLKTETFLSLSEKNRSASRDDQPVSPFKSGRELVKTTLEPGQLLTGPAAAIARTAQGQALVEFDNWYQANPRATREEAIGQAQEVVKRYQIIPYDQMKLATGISPYFGNKTRAEVTSKDVDAAEGRLANDIRAGRLSKPQQEFEIRRLMSWRDILAKELAAKGAANGRPNR